MERPTKRARTLEDAYGAKFNFTNIKYPSLLGIDRAIKKGNTGAIKTLINEFFNCYNSSGEDAIDSLTVLFKILLENNMDDTFTRVAERAIRNGYTVKLSPAWLLVPAVKAKNRTAVCVILEANRLYYCCGTGVDGYVIAALKESLANNSEKISEYLIDHLNKIYGISREEALYMAG
jgi:hypothetical protein